MKLKVSFEVQIPANATQQEAIEWVKYEIGATCSISMDNPLEDSDLMASNVRGVIF